MWEYTRRWDDDMEKAWPRQSNSDKDGEYSFLRTECGNSWYSVNKNPMRRDGCICPKCGKIVRVVMPVEEKNYE